MIEMLLYAAIVLAPFGAAALLLTALDWVDRRRERRWTVSAETVERLQRQEQP